jgi:hypothetical protein
VGSAGGIQIGSACINERRAMRPSGEIQVIEGESDVAGTSDRVIEYAVEVEAGLPVDTACFAAVVEMILSDERSWIGGGRISMRRVDEEPDLRVTLASPDVVDAYCLPLRTGGIYSCWDGARAMLNFDRWQHGADDFDGMLHEYRTYVVNHEVGHGLGYGHRTCTGDGDPAPVMMQQTKSVGSCQPNGWPTERELR